MTYIALTAGLLIRTLYESARNYKKTDPATIGIGLLAGFYGVGKMAEDYNPQTSSLEPWVALPVIFAAVVAFGYKKRLLPRVTEGTLLVYGLVAAYLYLTKVYSADQAASFFDIASFLFLALYLPLALIQNFTNVRLPAKHQTFYMALFIIVSIFIVSWISVATVSLAAPMWELVLVGYIFLPFVANIFYILYFIPIPLSKRETFKQRWQKIKIHSQDLEEQYFDVDTPFHKILWSVLLVGFLVLLDMYTALSQPLLISIILSTGLIITAPPQVSRFTPYSIRKHL